jgi:hypothetical protein
MMARVPEDHTTLQEKARRHLWLHFSRLAAYAERDIPVFVRGEGVHLFDDTGKRYLDGLSGLFVVQIGHGRRELAEAAASQAERLAYYPIWSAAHPAAVELAARIAGLAPGDLNRVFFTTGGSEAVESAWKLARAYFRAIGQPGRTKVIARTLAYHGTTMGALSITGLPAIKNAFEPLVPGVAHVANTNRFRSSFAPEVTADDDRFADACADAIEQAIVAEGPETVCAVYLEPVQNTGGCFPPPPGYFPRVREICDRHGVLLVSDEVICGFGRLGLLFGSEVYGIEPDLVTVAKGLTSGYFPLSAVILSERVWSVLRAGSPEVGAFAHGFTYSGHPVGAAAAMANLDVLLGEDMVGNSARTGAYLEECLREHLGSHPLVGDLRGLGLIAGVELVADRASRRAFDPALKVAQQVAARCLEDGLIVRALPVGHVIALSPPLCITRGEVDRVVDGLGRAIRAVGDELSRQGAWRAA